MSEWSAKAASTSIACSRRDSVISPECSEPHSWCSHDVEPELEGFCSCYIWLGLVGEQCDQPTQGTYTLIIVSSLMLLNSMIILGFCMRVIWIKIAHKDMKFNAMGTTILFTTATITVSLVLPCSWILGATGQIYASTMQNYFVTISLGGVTVFGIPAILNTSLMWFEAHQFASTQLELDTTSQSRAPSTNLQKTRKVVVGPCIICPIALITTQLLLGPETMFMLATFLYLGLSLTYFVFGRKLARTLKASQSQMAMEASKRIIQTSTIISGLLFLNVLQTLLYSVVRVFNRVPISYFMLAFILMLLSWTQLAIAAFVRSAMMVRIKTKASTSTPKVANVQL